MIVVGVEGHNLLLGPSYLRQNPGNAADVLRAVDGGERLDADVRVEAIIDLGRVFEIVTVADRLVADVTCDEDSLSCMNGNEARVRVVNGAVGDISSGEDLGHGCGRRDCTGHVEVDRIVADFAAL